MLKEEGKGMKERKVLKKLMAFTLSLLLGMMSSVSVVQAEEISDAIEENQVEEQLGENEYVLDTDEEDVLKDEEKPEVPSGYKVDLEQENEVDLYQDEKELASANNSCGDNAAWNLNNGVLTISGTGAMSDYSGRALPAWYSQRAGITSIVVSEGITYVGSCAFYGLNSVTTVSLPSSLTACGNMVFAECSGLSSVSVPAGVTSISYAMFANCTSLSTMSAPGATAYGDYAFQGCNFSKFTVGRNVNTISSLAFFNMNATEFEVEAGNTVYFASNGVLFTDGGATLYAYPSSNTNTSYIVPNTVRKIGDLAFNNNKYVTQITIGNSVTSLGESAFQACSGLESITIPDSVTEAGDFTFYECPNLKSINFGRGLKETSYQMFEECSALTTINFGEGLSSLAARTFGYCSGLKNVSLPATIKSIGNGCFGECSNLQSVALAALTDIPYQAFLNDYSLTTVSLNEGLTTINRYAFGGCGNLRRITLPSTIKIVYSYGFPDATEVVQTGTALTQYGHNGYRSMEKVSVSCTRNYNYAYEVLNIVNQRRSENGLAPLVMNSSLMESAMQRAAETSILFSHTRPDSSLCFDINSLMYGENIASGYSDASSVMTGWMNSSGHKANILDTDYTTIGIGCVNINGVWYWTQCFGIGADSNSCSKPSDTYVTETINIAAETFKEAPTTSGIIWGEQESYTYTVGISVSKTDLDLNSSVQANLYIKNPGNSQCTIVNNDENIVWSSSNSSVATIENGVIKAIKTGGTTITAATKNGAYKASLQIGVNIGTFVTQYGNLSFYRYRDGKMRCYDENFNMIKNQFVFDGSYTYYMQADGTPMCDRLTYHPDGVHIIYLDSNGHEVFNNFQYCPSVGYTCYFDSQGYIYKDVITFANNAVYYLDANGRMQNSGWFQFANGVDYGFANWDGTLNTGGFTYDPWGRIVFYHWNGMVARGLITDGVYYYSMDTTDGHYLGSFPVN